MRVDTPDGRGGAADAKRALRTEMRAARARLRRATPHAGRALAEACARDEVFSSASSVAVYHPIGSEIDVFPLTRLLAGRGIATAFPAIRGRHMVFLRYDPDLPFSPDACGVPAPPPGAPMAAPDVVIAPLLAFDTLGGRLGYGGGWYDRALWTFKRTHSDLCVYGAAFSGQKVDYVARQPHDFLLDGVFTELGAIPAAS